MSALMSRASLAVLAAAAVVPTAAFAQTSAPIPGDLIFDARLRFEAVDQDGLPRDAEALTLRTRLGYETPAFNGFKALVELENVTALQDRYNSTTNGKGLYPVVADPETTELNRAQVSWAGDQLEAVVGRQRLILNNARFVGNVGFRQNEQTFDAAKFVYRPAAAMSVTYAYVDRVQRIFGDDHPQGEWDSDSHLAQFDAKTRLGQASAYAYLLDFETAPAMSSATYGVRLTGARALQTGAAVTYEAEYARQTEYGNAPFDFDLDYIALSAGLKKNVHAVSLGMEQLDGNGRRGFQTPLATLHAFQGWADVFLTTPAEGLRDLSLKASTTVTLAGRPIRLAAAVHDFTDADGSTKYGSEFDVVASTPLTKALSAEIKAAAFDGARPQFADRAKLWMSLELKF